MQGIAASSSFFGRLTATLIASCLLAACGGPPSPPLDESSSSGGGSTPPAPAASIKINNDASSTSSLNVTVHISAAAYDEMYITADPTCAALGTWESRASTKAFTLAFENANNAIFAKFRIAATGVESSCVRDTIRHDNTPPTLVVNNPADASFITLSNQAALTIDGGCSELGTVTISGAINREFNCGLMPWSQTADLTSLPEGTVTLTFSARDSAGNTSAPITRTLQKDLTPPSNPALSINGGSLYTTSTSVTFTPSAIGANEMKISTGALCAAGTWEAYLPSKPMTLATPNALNTYSVSFRDQAGNVSSCATASITHDNIAPTVTFSSPAANAWVGSGGVASYTMAGACSEEGRVVTLTGAVSATAPCSSGAWTRTLNISAVANGSFTVTASIDDLSGQQGQSSRTFRKDTDAPALVVVTSPESPHTSGGTVNLTGTCETGATVYLSGASSANTACSAGTFAFTLTRPTDNTYNYQLRQRDPATNYSGYTAFQWIKNSTVVNPPTLSSPSSPHRSNTAQITINGTCDDGNDVRLTGDVLAGDMVSPAGSLSIACAGSSYSFTIQKGTDGAHSMQIRQWQGTAFSTPISFVWNRDATAPNTTLTLTPPATNVYTSARLEFSADEPGATFECSMNGGVYASCSSPLVLSGLSNSAQTVDVRAVDDLGNTDATPAHASWTQAAYGTVALYHFTSGSEMDDGSLHSGAMKSHLNNNGSTNSATAKFGNAQSFDGTQDRSAEAIHTETHNTCRDEMTIDLWARFATLPSVNGTKMVLISKDGDSGTRGWQIGIYRNATNHNLYFIGSLDGVTTTQQLSTTAFTLNTTAFHHFAITWNKGTINFYRNGGLLGAAKTIGTPGSASLHPSTAPLRLGTAVNMANTVSFNGFLDDVRMSRVVRWGGAFTAPTAQVNPD